MTDNEIVGEQVKIKAERVANPLMWVGDGEPDAYAAFKMELENAQDKKDLAVVLAIQDVLALHRPFAYLDPIDFMVGSTRELTYLPWCVECSSAANEEDGVDYPCPTRQAITNRIGVE